MTIKSVIKWIGKNFGFGIENYNEGQIVTLFQFVKNACSDDYGNVERQSLENILEYLNKLDYQTRQELYDYLKEMGY